MNDVRRPISALLSAMGALSLMTLASCTNNPAEYPDTAPVTGTVTLDGQPLGDANISFVPAEGGRPATGVTDASGKYELHYTGSIRGAMLGAHVVTISKELTKNGGDPLVPPEIEELVPKRYRGKTSELAAEVAAGKNTIDFAMVSQ